MMLFIWMLVVFCWPDRGNLMSTVVIKEGRTFIFLTAMEGKISMVPKNNEVTEIKRGAKSRLLVSLVTSKRETQVDIK